MYAIVRIVRHSEHRTSLWAGGVTTELAIYPPGRQYAARDFAWRVSSATVTTPTSEFTLLPGYERHLLVLEGQLRLCPDHGPGAVLRQGDQYAFSGATPIRSCGLATDFNLMLDATYAGSLSYCDLAPGESLCWRPADADTGACRPEHALMYCWHGEAAVTGVGSDPNAPRAELAQGDLWWGTANAGEHLESLCIVNRGSDRLIAVLVCVLPR